MPPTLQSTTPSVLFATGQGSGVFFPKADSLRDPLQVATPSAEGEQQTLMWGAGRRSRGSGRVDVVHHSGAAEERSFEAQSKRGKDLSSPFL